MRSLSKSVFTLIKMIVSHFYAQDGREALHVAALKGHHETCQFLIKQGASVDFQVKVRDNRQLEYGQCKLKMIMCVHAWKVKL